MASAVREFASSLQEGDVALFYFAGHGARAMGQSYLIPSNDEGIVNAEDLADYAYAASALLARLEGRPGVTSIIILDACRNNPLASRNRDMAEGGGLAAIQASASASTFIMFAAAEGRVASDGEGRNSRFTKALLTALERPERRLDDIAYDVRAMVRRESAGAQIPWTNSSLDAPVYLVPAPPADEEVEQPEEGLIPDGAPSYDPVTLTESFMPDPMRLPVLAGGTEEAAQADPACTGFIAPSPDYLIDYRAGTYALHFSVASAADTVLVVRDPKGRWFCNDDHQGANPAVSFTAPGSGQYRIWVGVYGADAGYPGAVLLISEIKPQF
jgi:hypothetical protein